MTLGTRIAWFTVAGLAVLNLGLAVDDFREAPTQTTYVLTPIVDVVPQGSPLEATEVEALMAALRTPEDPNNVQEAFATLGSTLSLHDLLRGIESLEGTDIPLSASQSDAIAKNLEAAKADHEALVALQEEILVMEAKLGRDINRVMMRLPPEDRGRIVAALGEQR